MSFLYRGVSKEKDRALKGLLCPNGIKPEVSARYDGQIKFDGTFTYGETSENAVRAHQIQTGLYGGCYISTTEDVNRSAIFATSGYSEEGWVYVIDPDKFEQYQVVSKKFPDPLYPDEQEVSIRAHDCGSIPIEVIVDKYEVNKDGTKKT